MLACVGVIHKGVQRRIRVNLVQLSRSRGGKHAGVHWPLPVERVAVLSHTTHNGLVSRNFSGTRSYLVYVVATFAILN